MKPQLVAIGAAVAVAGAVVAATGALDPGIPDTQPADHHDVALSAADINDFLLSLEGVSTPPAALPSTPLGEVADGIFYNVVTSGTVTDGVFTPTSPITIAASDLLDSSLITGANVAAGIGYTNGYLGLSPTDTPGFFTFNDPLGVDFDHGLQALLTAFNQPMISLEELLNGASTTPMFDPSELNLDPADLGTSVSALTMVGDWTAVFTDFTNAFDLAFGITP